MDPWLNREGAERPGTAPMIRLAQISDAEGIRRIYEPIVAGTAVSFELVPPTQEQIEGRIEAGLPLAPWLVCARGLEVLGYAYASKHRERQAYQWSVDVAIYTDEVHRRCGIGRALYTSLLSCLRLQGFYAAHAGIALPNAGSVGLHEALGFRPVGVYPLVGFKLGAWHDVGWWQLPLRERAGIPEPPRPLAEAERDPEWPRALGAGTPYLRL